MGLDHPASKVEKRSISKILPYARNARMHSDAQVAKIAASIKEWGWTVPCVIDDDGMLLAGHGRVLAAQMLGIEDVPVVVARGWSEAKKRAYVIADNRLSESSTWDLGMLHAEISDLVDFGFDIDLVGFDPEDISDLMPANDPDTGSDRVDDVPPVSASATVTALGDVWVLGDHRLVCGDCTNDAVASKAIDASHVDMILTDPPYGVDYTGRTANGLKIQNDNLSKEDLSMMVRAVFDSCQRWSRPGAYWYATVPSGPLHLIFALDWDRRGILRQILIWNKNSMVLGRSEYHYKHEPILFGWMPGGERHKNTDRTRTTVWDFDRPLRSEAHPTMKPVDLWRRAIVDGSRPGEIVYDPFCGSGTTVIACEALGRRARVSEIDPAYCDVIVERWQNFSGEKAVRVAGGSGSASA